MNVLLIGSGGREHALAWKIARSPLLSRLVCVPGNPGIEQVCECRPVKATDIEAIVALARELAADLVVVGPEAPLELGLADRLAEKEIACFGPSALAARLETSKAFTRDFAARNDVPGAAYGVFETAEAARPFLDRLSAPYVIKADGLAAGKGVVIAETRAEADAAVADMLGGRFGAAGARVVIEEFMVGEEASLFALCDGEMALLFGAAQDHKRAYDGDEGPNTGGMGTYSPPPVLTHQLTEIARRTMVERTVEGMTREGTPYVGVLYAGLMLTADGPRLVEYNARFGDPECQALMLRLDSDLLAYLAAAANRTLASLPEPAWRPEATVCVVLAAEGYPEAPVTGGEIRGAEADFGEHVVVFHAGTRRDPDGTLRSAGGRVLNVCARGATLRQARDRAYAAVAAIDFPQGFHRTDIGWRALG